MNEYVNVDRKKIYIYQKEVILIDFLCIVNRSKYLLFNQLWVHVDKGPQHLGNTSSKFKCDDRQNAKTRTIKQVGRSQEIFLFTLEK